MKLKLIVPVLTLASASIPTGYGQSSPGCGAGKLLDVREEVEFVPTVSIGRVHRAGKHDWTTVELPSSRKQTTYTVKVALDGVLYTARSNGDFWAYNPSRLSVGDEVEACVEGNRLAITRHDGRRYKPAITRRERDQATGTDRKERLP